MKLSHAAALALALVVFSCAPQQPWRAEYLGKSEGSATEDDVASKLGVPTLTRKLENGGEVWVYKFSGVGYGAYGAMASGGSYCTSYVLTFDSTKILRQWVRDQSCVDEPQKSS
jgi:hypothetical protein